MARGGKRSGRGGGLRRPPPVPGKEAPESQEPPRGGGPGRGSSGGGRRGGKQKPKRQKEDPPDEASMAQQRPVLDSSDRRAGRSDGRRDRRPSPPSSASTIRDPDHDHRSNDPREYSQRERGSGSRSTKGAARNGRDSDKRQRSRNTPLSAPPTNYPYDMDSESDRHNGDYPLLDGEEEQYEEFQEQHYRQQHYAQPQSYPSQPQAEAAAELQSFSASHRQFSLKPIYDVEMAPVKSKKGKRQKETSGRKQMKGRYSQLSQEGSSQKNPLEYNGKVLAYLDSESEGSSISDDFEGGGGSRRHSEFYSYSEDDENDDSFDDDEERPLRRSRSSDNPHLTRRNGANSILSRSEQCLNRTLLLAFAIVTFVFVRDRTPWWKEHERRVASQKHHHHHVLAGTDDDDLQTQIDPFAVYNSNDDDSTHTRDHDPLGRYDKFTKHDVQNESDTANAHDQAKSTKQDGEGVAPTTKYNNQAPEVTEESAENLDATGINNPDKEGSKSVADIPDSTDKYNQATAGERISKRPGSKSLHHGFSDETYSNRPPAQNSGSSALIQAEAANSHSSATTNGVESVQLSPMQASSGGDLGNGSGQSILGSGGGSIMGENAPKTQQLGSSTMVSPAADSDVAVGEGNGLQEAPPPPPQASILGDGDVDEEKGRPADGALSAQADASEDMFDRHDVLIEWGEPEDGNVLPPAQLSPAKEVNLVGNDPSKDGTNNHQSAPPLGAEPVAKAPDADQNKPIMNQALSREEIKSVYENSYFRWNHPLRPVAPNDPGKDVPIFWRIPRSASGTVESVMSFCYRMVLASSMGVAAGHDKDETIDVVTVGTGAQYVNVDMSRPAGIQRAMDMNLGSSGLADAISTSFLFETAPIFQGPVAGKCFTLLRHPVDRAISLYHHYQIDESDNPNTAQYRGMSVDEYAEKSEETNWMVRFLSNKRSGSLSWHDLEAAKEVFGRKCLVGLVDEAEESLRRYERFFGWDKKMPNSEAKDMCLRQYLVGGDKRKEHPTYEGTAAWDVLRKKNEYDVLLYEYAKNLYNQQTSLYEKVI